MVNQPTYNPNDRSQFSAGALSQPGHHRSSSSPARVSSHSIVAAALESGQYRPSSIVDTAPGYVTVGAKKIEDRRNLGRVSLTTILARSVNVGVTKLAMTLQPDQLWETMTQFGFGRLTTSGFPGESAGMLTHFSNWQPDQPGDACLRLWRLGYAAAACTSLRGAGR